MRKTAKSLALLLLTSAVIDSAPISAQGTPVVTIKGPPPPSIADLQQQIAALTARVTADELYIYHGTRDSCSYVLYDLRTVPVGFKCKTSKGASFERVTAAFTDAWKGPNRVIWSGFIGQSTFEQAKQQCGQLHAELPSKADIEAGINDGFLEVLALPTGFFWTSTTAGIAQPPKGMQGVHSNPNQWTLFAYRPGSLMGEPVYGEIIANQPPLSYSVLCVIRPGPIVLTPPS